MLGVIAWWGNERASALCSLGSKFIEISLQVHPLLLSFDQCSLPLVERPWVIQVVRLFVQRAWDSPSEEVDGEGRIYRISHLSSCFFELSDVLIYVLVRHA